MPLDDEHLSSIDGEGIRKRKMVPPAEHSSYMLPDHIFVETACYVNHVEPVSSSAADACEDRAEGEGKSETATVKFGEEDRKLINWLYEDDGLRKLGNEASDAETHDRDGNEMKPLLHSGDEFKEDRANKAKLTPDRDGEPESVWAIAFQVFIPFLIAGFGTVGAGLVLDFVQHWEVFQLVSEIFILVPALLGLKGNLEMTLASRLSTQANLGNMDTAKEQWKMAYGNLALIQCQASVVGFLASIFAVVVAWIPAGKFDVRHAMLLCSSSLLTATIASLVLGVIMILVVICSRKLNINPDNVATPIAASLGDLTTLALLSSISSILFQTADHNKWIMPTLIVAFILLIPLWVVIAMRNKYTQEVLYSGWSPVISAMAISSIGGCILDFAVSRFKGIAVFQPVINGVGGNLVAVQASRISTYLHQRAKLGTLPPADRRLCMDPCTAFFSNHAHARTARVLILMVIPGHLIFTYGIQLLKAGHTSVTILFLVVYLSAAFLQVLLLLYIAHVMIHGMWKKCIDPDNSAIPYLTALGDLLGTALLAAAFILLYHIGDRDSDVGD